MIHPEDHLLTRAEQFEAYFNGSAAYTVAHNWGRLIVTEAAYAAYGLPSFAPNTFIGNVQAELDPREMVEIALLSPSELAAVETPSRPEPEIDTFPASIFTELQEDGRAQLVFGYEVDADEMLMISLTKVARREDVTVKEVERDFVDATDKAPAIESLQRQILRTITHGPRPVIHRAIFDLLTRRNQLYGSRSSRFFSALSGGDMRTAIKAGIIVEDFHDTFCQERFEHHFETAGDAENR